jgi:hypothetical protein
MFGIGHSLKEILDNHAGGGTVFDLVNRGNTNRLRDAHRNSGKSFLFCISPERAANGASVLERDCCVPLRWLPASAQAW